MADKFFDAMFTASVIGGTSEPAPVIVSKNITANGTYSALDDQADGYNPVVVDVPNTYTAGDEGKVVSGGALVAQTSTTATTNGTINTTTNNEVVVAVPNTYTAGDEGKVVSGGTLVAQTAYPSEITANNTYDTTNYNSVTVNVSSSQTIEIIKCTTTMNISGSPPNVNYFIILDRFNKKITFYFYAGRTPVNHSKVTGSHTYEFTPEITLSDIMSTVSVDFYTINRNKSTSGTAETIFVNSGGTYPTIDLANNKIIVDFGTTNSYDYIVYITGFSYT